MKRITGYRFAPVSPEVERSRQRILGFFQSKGIEVVDLEVKAAVERSTGDDAGVETTFVIFAPGTLLEEGLRDELLVLGRPTVQEVNILGTSVYGTRGPTSTFVTMMPVPNAYVGLEGADPDEVMSVARSFALAAR